jgi:competence protein ComEC
VLAQAGARQKVVDSSLPRSKIADVGLSFLNPPPGLAATRNDSSMVLRLSYGATPFLFTGDIEAQGERAMLERTSELGAWVIKVPHHGSQTSSTLAFIRAAHPRVAVISAGYLNRFNFPSPSVVQRYRDGQAQVFETDHDGAVVVDADGRSALLQAFRSGKSLVLTGAPRH